MPTNLKKTLVVGISATALFDMSESDRIFRETHKRDPDNAIEAYRSYMLKHEDIPLQPGTGYPIVEALLGLNRYQEDSELPLVEVVVMSRNSPDTGVRVLNTIRENKLAIVRSAFSAGETVVDYLAAFDVDLFLTTNIEDAQRVIDSRACAAAVLKPPPKNKVEVTEKHKGQVRIAFDGDAVLFDDESELVYKTEGLLEFQAQEDSKKDIPLKAGPYAKLLIKLSKLQERLPMRIEYSPIRIALVTARSSPAEMRVIKTLRKWGVYVDEAFFMGGLDKINILSAFRPHIFFDDQDIHLDKAANTIPSGKVPYLSVSKLSKDQFKAG